MQPKDLEGLHKELLRAALGEVSFGKIIDMITHQHNAAGGIIFEMNRKTGRIVNFVSPSLEIGEDAYNDHLNSINPRMRYSLRHAAGHVAFESKFIDQQGMDRHEFYDWLKREQSMQFFLGTRLYDEGDISVFHSIEFPFGQDHPEARAIEEFRRSSRAIGNAWKLAKRVQPNGLDSQTNGWTPDHLPWAIFALDASGAVVQMNSHAAEIIREGQLLYLEDKQLCARDRSTAPKFQNMLSNSLDGHGQDLLLPHVITQTKIMAQSLPVNTGALSTPSSIAVIIYVWNPMDGADDRNAVLRSLWGLTAAEARLALLIARGLSLADAANELSVSRNTARNQLQGIFGKMQTNRQTELAFKIFGVIDRQ